MFILFLIALSSNFRNSSTRGEALNGIRESTLIPINLNYEISTDKSHNFLISLLWMEFECINFTGIQIQTD